MTAGLCEEVDVGESDVEGEMGAKNDPSAAMVPQSQIAYR